MSDLDYSEVWQCYDYLPIQMLPAAEIMALVAPGDEGPWSDELAFLWTTHLVETSALLKSVVDEGINEPIIAGNDGRLWDGHHRLAVALALDIPCPVRVIPADEATAPLGHEFLPVAGHPDDDECTHRSDGTDTTYCGEPRVRHLT